MARVLCGSTFAQSADTEMQTVLNQFQEARSTQDTEAVLAFFADDATFEDVPLGRKASNKEELRGILNYTFSSVPNFTMDIFNFTKVRVLLRPSGSSPATQRSKT